ncbi:flagellar hook assembly protein FlgD [Rhodoferax aquaticus]|uniref:Basal-body rod modification protein FlgD n=1 Tax=Rhodoferax aquaticus TaxID=2527691 RepID=A0A515ETV0_9BURK|nr:flagellar hook capping FlgD N-terminal domain-containing protein [Rhodoferax aquaticus]QDL56110.1 flagellar hook assembly protein FlgD [Rhodoferax aquaticus]
MATTTPVTSKDPIAALADAGNTKKKTGQSDADASQDRFLKLLVAQLNNQDPMNPMDNAQMTSQLAQINTVSGLTQLNETVKTLGSQFSELQVMQGSSMIGRDILIQDNKLSITNGVAKGTIELPSNASKVSVEIISPGGKLVDTLNLGAKSAGRNDFTWDASKYAAGGTPTFKVTATQGNDAMTTTAYSRDTVVSVGTNNGAMSLQTKGRAAVAYADIKAIL